MNTILKALISTPLMVLGLCSIAIAGPHFQKSSAEILDDGALLTRFVEAGLGNTNIDYTLTADGAATYVCLNKGGKVPSDPKKTSVNSEVSAGATFQAKNGKVSASLEAGPPSAGNFSCPSGQRVTLACVSYTNIVLTDTTNNVVAPIPGSLSANILPQFCDLNI